MRSSTRRVFWEHWSLGRCLRSARAGIPKERVLGLNFFEAVWPCTNNYLIAQRYFDEPDLDDFLDYTFTLRMAPAPVRLRMMAMANSARQYLAVTAR